MRARTGHRHVQRSPTLGSRRSVSKQRITATGVSFFLRSTLFKREIESGADGDAKRFAKETLPTVEAHLQEIRQIADQIKVATADGKSVKDDK